MSRGGPNTYNETNMVFRSRLPTKGWYPGPIASDVHGLSVSLSLVTRMYYRKTAGQIEMPFSTWGRVGPNNHVLDVGRDPLRGRGNFGVRKE